VYTTVMGEFPASPGDTGIVSDAEASCSHLGAGGAMATDPGCAAWLGAEALPAARSFRDRFWVRATGGSLASRTLCTGGGRGLEPLGTAPDYSCRPLAFIYYQWPAVRYSASGRDALRWLRPAARGP
jgi:hypothetical protein